MLHFVTEQTTVQRRDGRVVLLVLVLVVVAIAAGAWAWQRHGDSQNRSRCERDGGQYRHGSCLNFRAIPVATR